MPDFPELPPWVCDALARGLVIPAHPLALDGSRRFDERRQRALTRYYHAAGAGGLAVGVHTTQFAVRDPEHRLFEPVLRSAVETASECDSATDRRTVLIAGICGETEQAVDEARCAAGIGYQLGLLSLSALKGADDATLIEHCRRVAHEIPLVGFYLQPAVGGRRLSVAFWREFATIPNVAAVKIAPFNRYATFDVVRGIMESGRGQEIALYTGNDDNIVVDLLTEYRIPVAGALVSKRIVGGLLGHWACWTRSAVLLMDRIAAVREERTIPGELLTLATQITDANAILFDAANGFAGCIPGIHEVLRRQGLLCNDYCLDPNECLSPGQTEEIDRIYRVYPDLNDDEFVREHLDDWLR